MLIRGKSEQSIGSTGWKGVRCTAFRASPRAVLAALLALAAFPGCTNNILKSASSALNSGTGSNPLAGINTGGGNSSGVTLAHVQLDTFNPTSTLDLLGDGSGAIGQACQPKGGAGGGGAAGQATTCTCAYTYFQANGMQIGPVEVDTSYHEANMLRCPYTVIPAGVGFVNIYIHMTNSDTQSNTVTLQLGANGAGTLDLSNPNSFTQVQRYQCRDIVFVPYMWDGATMYDPFLSEDPRYSYPLNFYSTNMGLTFSQYASDANAVGWHCPALPNDTAAGMDLTLYSVSADSSGSKAIFPPGGSAFDRSHFYVANAKAGVFNIPVNAYVYPGMVSALPQPAPGQGAAGGQGAAAAGAGGGGSPPPLGFAANPIPLAGGGETCPDSSVTIPAGYHWAKLWLFRKQLPQRAYPTSPSLMGFGNGQDGLACNSVPWTPGPGISPPQDTLFTDCSGAPNVGNLDPVTHLAARFSTSTGACFKIRPGGATNPLTGANYDGTTGNQAPGYGAIPFTGYPVGTDIWVPNNKDPKFGCLGTQVNDLSHACQATTGNVPFDATIPVTPALIDSTTANPRFDYLFVVSPPSVNRNDMVPTATSTTHAIYTPVRFMSPTDCKSSDPDLPTFPGDCSSSRMLTYQITVSQTGAPGQTGANDPNAPGSFPMCVLQAN